MKTQLIRLFDVVFIGPFMIYGGSKLKGTDKTILTALGIATIIYNGMNYLKQKENA